MEDDDVQLDATEADMAADAIEYTHAPKVDKQHELLETEEEDTSQSEHAYERASSEDHDAEAPQEGDASSFPEQVSTFKKRLSRLLLIILDGRDDVLNRLANRIVPDVALDEIPFETLAYMAQVHTFQERVKRLRPPGAHGMATFRPFTPQIKPLEVSMVYAAEGARRAARERLQFTMAIARRLGMSGQQEREMYFEQAMHSSMGTSEGAKSIRFLYRRLVELQGEPSDLHNSEETRHGQPLLSQTAPYGALVIADKEEARIAARAQLEHAVANAEQLGITGQRKELIEIDLDFHRFIESPDKAKVVVDLYRCVVELYGESSDLHDMEDTEGGPSTRDQIATRTLRADRGMSAAIKKAARAGAVKRKQEEENANRGTQGLNGTEIRLSQTNPDAAKPVDDDLQSRLARAQQGLDQAIQQRAEMRRAKHNERATER